ncbi:MAG: serine/threonine protein phosphatase [Ruminococcaceae bacterium]|nr:serine/threonine protein phosphatase [Oscillospiraceae bacterium]
MSLYAIADTHLSFGTDKPMDSFPGWKDYVERIEKNWNKLITDSDTVVIAGDISWAMNFEELYADFDFINRLKGSKIIIKGNHDYWWNTLTKMNKFISDYEFDTIQILQNNSFVVDGVSVCGSRGWMFESTEEHDEKVLNREVGRIKMSLDSAVCEEKILFLHYPPVTTDQSCEAIMSLINEYNIKNCYYGHLHGAAARFAIDDTINNCRFELISCDRLGFIPKLIKR